MPELTDSYPNEGAFAQCSYFQTGPPPIALTAVNEIVLPVLTLPRSTTADNPSETTTSSSASSPTTSARPGPSEASQIPSRTSVSRTADATISSGQSGGSSAPPPRPSSGSEEQGDGPDVPSNPTQVATTSTRPAGNGQATTTASPGGGPPVVAPPGSDDDDDDEQASRSDAPAIPAQGASTNPPPANANPSNPAASSNGAPPIIALPTETSSNAQGSPGVVVVGGSTTISAGGQAAAASGTTFSVLPSDGGVIGVANGETTTLPLPTPGPISEFVRPVTSAQPQGFVVARPTITQGGEGVEVSGITYSVLPSGSGIVAIGEAGSVTLRPSQLAGLGIAAVPGSEGGYAFADQTLAVGGSAVTIAGTTYSALPQGSGIAAAAGGESRVIAVSEATDIPGLGEVEILNQAGGGGDVYVLDGSVTVSAGGAAVTISNTAYSALPAGFGVVVTPDGDGDEFAIYIEQGVSGIDSEGGGQQEQQQQEQQGENYIIGAELLLSSNNNGAGVTTVSGTVYSALPSGSGVLVVADGTSTTIAIGPTGDGGSDEYGRPDPTGSSKAADPDESVVAYAGAAAPARGGLGWIGLAGYSGFVVFVGVCLAG